MNVVKDFDFIEFYPDTSIEAYDVLVGVLGNDLETLSLAIQLEDCARAHLTT